jgi:hypothetical protein
MSTVKRSLLALLIAPIALGAVMAGSASAARAHQPIAIRATLQGRTLQVTGRNFDPGTRIAIAVLDTRSWRALFAGSAMAEPATYQCRKGTSVMCGLRDPDVGELSFDTTLQRPPSPQVLAVLYRSRAEIGFGRVDGH